MELSLFACEYQFIFNSNTFPTTLVLEQRLPASENWLTVHDEQEKFQLQKSIFSIITFIIFIIDHLKTIFCISLSFILTSKDLSIV